MTSKTPKMKASNILAIVNSAVMNSFPTIHKRIEKNMKYVYSKILSF